MFSVIHSFKYLNQILDFPISSRVVERIETVGKIVKALLRWILSSKGTIHKIMYKKTLPQCLEYTKCLGNGTWTPVLFLSYLSYTQLSASVLYVPQGISQQRFLISFPA